MFPAGVHDDAVDSTTQALNYLREQSDCLGVIEYLKRLDARLTAETAKPTDPPCCPQCGATCIVNLSGQWHCNQCGHQWAGNQPRMEYPTRKDILNGWRFPNRTRFRRW